MTQVFVKNVYYGPFIDQVCDKNVEYGPFNDQDCDEKFGIWAL